MAEEAVKEKIIGLAETIFIVLLVGVEEFVEFILLVVTLGTGIMVVEIMNGAVFMMIEMYMLLRGGRGIMKLIVEPVGAAINGATGGLAPGKTVATGLGIWIINNPEKIEKVTKIIAKVTGQAVSIAATAVGGAAGGAAAKVVGGKVVGTVAEKTVEKTAEAGASAVRSRMAMTTRVPSSKVIGADRMMQARAKLQQQGAQQKVPEAAPFQEAA